MANQKRGRSPFCHQNRQTTVLIIRSLLAKWRPRARIIVLQIEQLFGDASTRLLALFLYRVVLGGSLDGVAKAAVSPGSLFSRSAQQPAHAIVLLAGEGVESGNPGGAGRQEGPHWHDSDAASPQGGFQLIKVRDPLGRGSITEPAQQHQHQEDRGGGGHLAHRAHGALLDAFVAATCPHSLRSITSSNRASGSMCAAEPSGQTSVDRIMANVSGLQHLLGADCATGGLCDGSRATTRTAGKDSMPSSPNNQAHSSYPCCVVRPAWTAEFKTKSPQSPDSGLLGKTDFFGPSEFLGRVQDDELARGEHAGLINEGTPQRIAAHARRKRGRYLGARWIDRPPVLPLLLVVLMRMLRVFGSMSSDGCLVRAKDCGPAKHWRMEATQARRFRILANCDRTFPAQDRGHQLAGHTIVRRCFGTRSCGHLPYRRWP